jgi:hypothetical protein
MRKVIVYTNSEGRVSVVVPTPEALLTRTIEEIAKKDVPQGINYVIVDESDVPSDRTFRNAWEHSNGIITPNFPKSVELTKERLRKERIPLLADLDVQFQRAQETNANTKDIVAEKNRLRDITKEADKCTTLDQLKSLTCLQVNNVV